MSKSLEALENIAVTFDEMGFIPTTSNPHYNFSFSYWFGNEYNIIKQDLERLKKLEKDYNLLDTTMESDDRIICKLLKEKEQLKNDIKLNEAQIDDLTLEVANYKHALEEKNEIIMDLKVEKEELEQQLAYECGCNSQLVDYQNAIDILKDKVKITVKIPYVWIETHDNCVYFKVNQQEYELLKEVLK